MTYLIIYLIGYISFSSQEMYNEIYSFNKLSKKEISEILIISLIWPILTIMIIYKIIREL